MYTKVTPWPSVFKVTTAPAVPPLIFSDPFGSTANEFESNVLL